MNGTEKNYKRSRFGGENNEFSCDHATFKVHVSEPCGYISKFMRTQEKLKGEVGARNLELEMIRM